MSLELLQLILGGSVLTALGGVAKYAIDVVRQGHKDRAPLSIATATSQAAQHSIEILTRVNAELDGENSRLRSLLHEHQSSELAYLEEIRTLRAQVSALMAQLAHLNDNLAELERRADKD